MLLAFVVVLFGGLVFMFFCISRSQEALLKATREEHALLADRLHRLETRIHAGCTAQNEGIARNSADEVPETLHSVPLGDTRYGSPLEEMNLQLKPVAAETSSRSTRRESGLPDLKM